MRAAVTQLALGFDPAQNVERTVHQFGNVALNEWAQEIPNGIVVQRWLA